MLNIAAVVLSEGVTVRSILTDLPHDPASVVGYLFIAAFIGLIVLGSRRGGGPEGPAGKAGGA